MKTEKEQADQQMTCETQSMTEFTVLVTYSIQEFE